MSQHIIDEPSFRPEDWALHDAVTAGDMKKLVDLSFTYPKLNYNSKNVGQTPLHEAIRVDKAYLIPLLVEKGCNINAVDKDKETPLHKAASYGKLDCVKTLLRFTSKIKINEYDRFHKTPLDHAERNTKHYQFGNHEEVLSILIDANNPALTAQLEHLAKERAFIEVQRLQCYFLMHNDIQVTNLMHIKRELYAGRKASKEMEEWLLQEKRRIDAENRHEEEMRLVALRRKVLGDEFPNIPV